MYVDMLKAIGVNTELSPDEKWIQGEVSSADWVGSSTAAIATIPLPCKPIELWCMCVSPTRGSYQTIFHYIQSSERVYGMVGNSYLFWTNGYAVSDPDSSPQVNYINRIYEVTDSYFKLKYNDGSYGSNKIIWLARIPKDTTDSIVTRYAHGENVALPASGRLEVNCGFRPKQFRIHMLPETGCYRDSMFYDEKINGTTGYTFCMSVIYQPDGSYYSANGAQLSSQHLTPELTANGFTVGSISSDYSQHFNWEAWG